MTTILTSYSLVPELQHYFNRFVVTSNLNKDIIPPPVDIALPFMPENSFIEMLFNDEYNKSSYEYRYIAETNMGCIPRIAIARLQIYPGSWQYLVLDSDGDNVFNLQPHDFAALDALLAYRNGATDSTSLILIDSTGVSFVSDTTAGISILYGSYNSFSTELSKLIYLFLRLETLDDFSLYNNEFLVSTGGLVETCYEAYLIEKYFDFMTEKEPNLIYDCKPCNQGDQN
jgi:hypothetical protein